MAHSQTSVTTNSSKKPFDFFISYNQASAHVLARDYYYTAIANGLHPWLDEVELPAGTNFPQRAREGIENSDGYLLLATPKALISDPVKFEIELAINAHSRNPSFKIIVVLIDGAKIDDFHSFDLEQFIYVDSSRRDKPPAMLRVLESLTGKEMLPAFLRSAYHEALATGGVNNNSSSEELLSNKLLTLVTQLNNFLNSNASTSYPQELADTLNKVINFSPLEGLPKLTPGWWTYGNGIFETLHANRMRIPPRINFPYLPNDAEFKILDQNEVLTRVQFLQKGTNKPYLKAFPFTSEFDAEL